MSLLIKKPGILTTVQDLGRYGEQRFGLNPAGVMDRTTARLLNIILGNEETAAVLETHFPACEIVFEADSMIAIGGADFYPHVDGYEVANETSLFVPKDSTMTFRKRMRGQRAYLAVREGLQVNQWRKSRATNLIARAGGHKGRKLTAGDRISCMPSADAVRVTLGNSLRARFSQPRIRVVAGNEYEFLTAVSERDFWNEKFTLTNDCDRMGYRLSGKPLYMLDPREMTSVPVTFGTIQLLPDGQLIILMADHQTSGGYPRVATVVSVDLPLLAQCGPGDSISFELVSIDEAERVSLEFERELNFLRVGCRLQGQNATY